MKKGMVNKCYFCESESLSDVKESSGSLSYNCQICGHVFLTEEASEDLGTEKFIAWDKQIISIWLRNEYERRYRKPLPQPLNLEYLHQIVKQYTPLSPLDKMDNALQIIDKKSYFVGRDIAIDANTDYSYFHCFASEELKSLLILLHEEGYIKAAYESAPHLGLRISANGYKKLRALEKQGRDSRQCFVAMWFAPEMKAAYETAIKPAIEYIEEGKTAPRFYALKIDNVDHINDINDEIIAAIRRSRFMVCDLTGYRGGVYFEAGFAYGLGLDVIYTCRKDWTKYSFLKTKENEEVNVLYDSDGREIEIKKEGVHFDIEHRNRIEWEENKLDEFRDKLEKRIKAVIL